MVDTSKIEAVFVEDVADYMGDNNMIPENLANLEPAEFFAYYLAWNGIIGYDKIILRLLSQLGWQAPSVT